MLISINPNDAVFKSGTSVPRTHSTLHRVLKPNVILLGVNKLIFYNCKLDIPKILVIMTTRQFPSISPESTGV